MGPIIHSVPQLQSESTAMTVANILPCATSPGGRRRRFESESVAVPLPAQIEPTEEGRDPAFGGCKVRQTVESSPPFCRRCQYTEWVAGHAQRMIDQLK